MEQSESGLDPAIVGRRYLGKLEVVDPERVALYAKATNETNPRYFAQDETKLAVPPIFPVTMYIDLMIKIVTDDSLNLDISRMVHGEQEILYHRPLKPWDNISTEVELESIDVKESGDILWAVFKGLSEDETVFEMRSSMFFRKPRKRPKPRKLKESDEIIEKQIVVRKQMNVTSDQSVRYAAASGDENPIHLDKDFATAVGLPDIILHGLCTLAFATQAIVDGLAEGDPTKVKKVRTRFSKPVFMNDTLTTEGWMLKKNSTSRLIGFETRNQTGETVLTLGQVELLN